jgi:hypothetical protein
VFSIRYRWSVAIILLIAGGFAIVRANTLIVERARLEQSLRIAEQTTKQKSVPAVQPVKEKMAQDMLATTNEFSRQLLITANTQGVLVSMVNIAAPIKIELQTKVHKSAINAQLSGAYIKVKASLAELSAQFPGLALEQVALTKQPGAIASTNALNTVQAQVRWSLYANMPEEETTTMAAKP